MSLKLKRYIGWPVLLALVACALILGMGDQRIYAYSAQGTGPVVAEAVSLGSDAALHLATAAGSIQLVH